MDYYSVRIRSHFEVHTKMDIFYLDAVPGNQATMAVSVSECLFFKTENSKSLTLE